MAEASKTALAGLQKRKLEFQTQQGLHIICNCTGFQNPHVKQTWSAQLLESMTTFYCAILLSIRIH